MAGQYSSDYNVARPLTYGGDERSLLETRIDDLTERVWQQNNIFWSPNYITMHNLAPGEVGHTWKINGDSPEDGAHHTPGQWIEGGTLTQLPITVTLDDDFIKAIRIPFVDDVLSKWDEVSRALGECIRIVTEKMNNRAARLGLLAARASAVSNVHAGGYTVYRTGATSLATIYPQSDTGAGYIMADLEDVALTWDNRNYPKDGRICYMKPYGISVLTNSNKLMSRDYVPANITMLHERAVGMCAGFQIVPVTCLPDNEEITTDLTKYNGDFLFNHAYGNPLCLCMLNDGLSPVGGVQAGGGFRNIVAPPDEDHNTTLVKSQLMAGMGQLAVWKAASISARITGGSVST